MRTGGIGIGGCSGSWRGTGSWLRRRKGKSAGGRRIRSRFLGFGSRHISMHVWREGRERRGWESGGRERRGRGPCETRKRLTVGGFNSLSSVVLQSIHPSLNHPLQAFVHPSIHPLSSPVYLGRRIRGALPLYPPSPRYSSPLKSLRSIHNASPD